ncbi:Carbon monoxide dehydrogenase small chain [Azospirillaceae bacterium]
MTEPAPPLPIADATIADTTIADATIVVTVNGARIERAIAPHALLVELLRDDLKLTGVHVGCDTGHCGACVVLVDGRSVKSCATLAMQVDGRHVTTIEGLSPASEEQNSSTENLHPMQAAFRENHGLQCGFCTPGVVLSALDLVSRHPQPSDSQIRAWLEGHLCRCTGYHNIVKAIQTGAQKMAQTSETQSF